MNAKINAIVAPDIEKFVDLFQRGYEAWVEAGRVVVQALESDPDFADKVHEKHPEISIETVYAFDRLGRQDLHPKLLISDSPGAKRLRQLRYHVQEKFVEKPVPVLIKTDSGWETLKVSVFDLTSDQASQVFDKNDVRNDHSQRAYIEGKKASKAVKSFQVDMPYRVVGRKLVVMKPCQFTLGQLTMIVAEMSKD